MPDTRNRDNFVIWHDPVNDSVGRNDEFANIIVVFFWDDSSDSWEIRQQIHFGN